MNLFQGFLEALDSLVSNKLRSGLTVLGIVIGVGAVIGMLAIGRGAEDVITGSISDIGTNLLFVIRGGSEEVRNPQPLTMGDANAINDPFSAPSVIGVAPFISGSVEVSFAGESSLTQGSGFLTGIYTLTLPHQQHKPTPHCRPHLSQEEDPQPPLRVRTNIKSLYCTA